MQNLQNVQYVVRNVISVAQVNRTQEFSVCVDMTRAFLGETDRLVVDAVNVVVNGIAKHAKTVVRNYHWGVG